MRSKTATLLGILALPCALVGAEDKPSAEPKAAGDAQKSLAVVGKELSAELNSRLGGEPKPAKSPKASKAGGADEASIAEMEAREIKAAQEARAAREAQAKEAAGKEAAPAKEAKANGPAGKEAAPAKEAKANEPAGKEAAPVKEAKANEPAGKEAAPLKEAKASEPAGKEAAPVKEAKAHDPAEKEAAPVKEAKANEPAGKKAADSKLTDNKKLDPQASKLNEVKVFTKRALAAVKSGDNNLADTLLESLVAIDLPDEDKKVSLQDVADVYESKGDRTKAIAIYEKLCAKLNTDPSVPQWLMKLGYLYRDTGAYALSISRFYGVINMSIKVGSNDFETYRVLTRKAQREIADTHFLKGDFDQAQKFYNMALKSELSAEDKPVVTFRAAHSTFMRGDMNAAVNAFERLLKDYSRHASAAEARYMLAAAYKAQKRPQDAYDTVLELLRDAKAQKGTAPAAWAYWQKKAGNEFANDYYQQGEFVQAVTIYQALAAVDDTPEWRWPVVYQMGLCFERLRLERRAVESYKYISDESKKAEASGKKMPQSVTHLVDMAKWRVEQLAWEDTVQSQMRAIGGGVEPRVPR